MYEDDNICLGIILKPWGTAGYIKVQSFTNPITNIFDFPLYDYDDKEYKLSYIRTLKDSLICEVIEPELKKTKDFHKLRFKKLYTSKSNLPELSEDEFYINDLEGLPVFNKDQNQLGKIIEVHRLPSVDAIEIQFLNDACEIFPFRKEFFPEVASKYVIFVYPDIV